MKIGNALMAGLVGGLVAASAPASAASIVTNQWYEGSFNAAGSWVFGGSSFGGPNGYNGPILPSGTANPVFAPDGTSWSISLPSGGFLTLTDIQISGDRFDVYLNGSLAGSTSAPVGGSYTSDISAALADPNFSKGTFALGAGTTDISFLFTGSINYGNMEFIVQGNPVPVPATLGLAAAAAAALGLVRRRRRA